MIDANTRYLQRSQKCRSRYPATSSWILTLLQSVVRHLPMCVRISILFFFFFWSVTPVSTWCGCGNCKLTEWLRPLYFLSVLKRERCYKLWNKCSRSGKCWHYVTAQTIQKRIWVNKCIKGDAMSFQWSAEQRGAWFLREAHSRLYNIREHINRASGLAPFMPEVLG
jgi:hypothetical protein